MDAIRNIVISSAITTDIQAFVALSYKKRRSYEKAQPQFWKYAGDVAEESQSKWFKELLSRDDYIMLSTKNNGQIVGFIIGRLIPAPEVYNPGGLTLMVDDFCVKNEADWHSVGRKLIDEIKSKAAAKGAAQILVVCGAHDKAKRQFLKIIGLTTASEWYVGGIV